MSAKNEPALDGFEFRIEVCRENSDYLTVSGSAAAAGGPRPAAAASGGAGGSAAAPGPPAARGPVPPGNFKLK